MKDFNYLDVVITTLEANVKMFKQIRDKLNEDEQQKILLPIMVELRNLCDVCIPVFKSKN
jgi:glutaredoxin-related protein